MRCLLLLAICITTVSASCEMLKKSHYDIAKSTKDHLRICTGENHCCSQETENQMVAKADRIFRSQLQDKVIILRHMLHTHLNSFRTYFYNSLNTCHTQLDTMFKKTYGPFYENNSKVFDTFFNRLRAFSSPYSDANVSSISNQLFHHLFRVVFSLLNPLHNVSDYHGKCMDENMADIQPFGDLPQKVSAHLDKALTNWRHFVAALESAHTVLDGFMNTTLSKECVVNLARMGDCSMCTVQQPITPCQGLCLNVMKGCLAEWAEIDQQWNAVVGGLQKLTQRLKGPHNLQNALNPLPVQLSEAVMVFQERGASVTNKVLARCFHPDDEVSSRLIRGKRAIWLRSVHEQAEGNWRILNQLMNTFGDRLSNLRGWFRSLPESFCSEDGMAAAKGEKCWNGTEVAGYTKGIAADGISQQSANPEYQKERFMAYRGVFVEERLKLGMLSFRLHNVLYGRNYSNYEIEGSADAELSDDEDYTEGSGNELSIVNLDPSSDPLEPQSADFMQQLNSSNNNSSLFVLCIIVLCCLTSFI